MKTITVDGNTATAYISYAFSEIAVIYPITPASPMAELADIWATNEKHNLFHQVPKVVQMQSEGGAAGALHGALTCGALATSYTCSQGLLLMQPNMYKIAGELLPTVLHVSARAIATHALSIFGDHQDVMACRQTGFAFLCASSVQECADMALIAHLATFKTSVPFLHFFDGFRTSHEISKIQVPDETELRALLPQKEIDAFRNRALTPKNPMQRGTAQNPDIYFQNRERANPYYLATPDIVQSTMDELSSLFGKNYHLFDYFGDKNAEYVAVLMGSGCLTMEETVEVLQKEGKKVGVVEVRLYRPFDVTRFCNALPKTCKKIAVLDRTKEAGSIGEPLYLDVCAALKERDLSIQVFGGRYGLGSKEFTPAACLAVFENLFASAPKNHFTVGIEDDVTHTSLPLPPLRLSTEHTSCMFYGLGSDGTVGANKNTIQILGEHTSLFVQGYFSYDSKKSGGVTVSHLRFGSTPIRSAYLIEQADFIACHNPSYPARYDMLSQLKEHGAFLLNCPWESISELEKHLPAKTKRQLFEKKASLYVINATKIANDVGLNGKTSTIMQAVFFLLHPHLLPYEDAISYLKKDLEKKFAKKGAKVLQMNLLALEKAETAMQQIAIPESWATATEKTRQEYKNDYYENFMKPILTLRGDNLPVSVFSPDGSVPTATIKYEKHGAPYLLPQWIKENCIQCNQCAFVCPHACIRPFLLPSDQTTPEEFSTVLAMGTNGKFRIQVSPEDCMGCKLCANICPTKDKALVMTPFKELLERERRNWAFSQSVETLNDATPFKKGTVKGSQFSTPLFEFSYACAGCGETTYIKILTQLFGDKMLIANATGCSSIYGGSAPSCPYTVNKDGKGPAWANSLFEDNAEFGLGMKLAQEIRQEKNQNSVWIIGGDGWAFDIGYGGLDHVLALGKNVNLLVLDSEVYSNTGGQQSKATPLGAIARFAQAGKRIKKKDLALMAMSYGYVYVAQVSLGANKQQLLNAFMEAESYDGPSLILAYSPCIAHGVDMSKSVDEEKLAVDSGYWQLFRFNPALKEQGKNPLSIDSKAPSIPLKDFLLGENRFAQLYSASCEQAERLFSVFQKEVDEKQAFLRYLYNFFETE